MDMDRSPNSLLEDDTCIPEELIGRLHSAAEGSVPDIVAAFTANERASLAMFCYHKSRLRRVGLAIANTCDLSSLEQEWGLLRGRAIFAQSRDRPEESSRMGVWPRPKITLARSAGGCYPPPIDLDDASQPTCSVPTAGIVEAA
jgi:hypothetical protein